MVNGMTKLVDQMRDALRQAKFKYPITIPNHFPIGETSLEKCIVLLGKKASQQPYMFRDYKQAYLIESILDLYDFGHVTKTKITEDLQTAVVVKGYIEALITIGNRYKLSLLVNKAIDEIFDQDALEALDEIMQSIYGVE